MEEKKKKYEEEPEEEIEENSDSMGTLFLFSLFAGILLNIVIIMFKYLDTNSYNKKSYSSYIFSWESLITTTCLVLFIFIILIAIATATKHNQPKSPTENENKNDQNKKEG